MRGLTLILKRMKVISNTFRNYVEGVEMLKSASAAFRQRRRQTPLERGWTSASPQGKIFWAPAPVDRSSKNVRTAD